LNYIAYKPFLDNNFNNFRKDATEPILVDNLNNISACLALIKTSCNFRKNVAKFKTYFANLFDGRSCHAVAEISLSLSLPLQLDKSPNLKTSGGPQESVEVFLRAGHLPSVHVHEQELHVLEVDILEDHDRVFAGVAKEQVSEVGAADGQDEFVGGKVVFPAGQGHVDEKLL
jgi:hypothetical protein